MVGAPHTRSRHPGGPLSSTRPQVVRRRPLLPGSALLAAVLQLAACSGDKADTSPPLDQACSPYPVPEDALTEDILTGPGSEVVCYRESPDGTCTALSSAEAAYALTQGGKEAIQCTDGVAQVGGSCPTDLLIGTCTVSETEVWSVYPCHRWDDLPGGAEAGCTNLGGSWSPAP